MPAGVARRAGRKNSAPGVQQDKARGGSASNRARSPLCVTGEPRRDQHNSIVPSKPVCRQHYQEKSHNLL